jgi:hypothetical protein
MPRNRLLIVADAVDVAAEGALWYARTVGDGDLRAVHVPGRRTDVDIRPRWLWLADNKPRLELLSRTEGRVDAVLEEVWKLPRGEGDVVTVVIPEQFRRRSIVAAAARAAFRLKLRLLSEPGVVVTDVPAISDQRGPEGRTPERLVVRVLVSEVNAASMRAVNYARALHADDTRAVFFAAEPAQARALGEAWAAEDVPMAVEACEAPYRDIGEPLLRYVRELTDDSDVAVNVVMPELVLHGWRRALHNQRALYIKRLLLFERRVILTSVPYQLFR